MGGYHDMIYVILFKNEALWGTPDSINSQSVLVETNLIGYTVIVGCIESWAGLMMDDYLEVPFLYPQILGGCISPYYWQLLSHN